MQAGAKTNTSAQTQCSCHNANVHHQGLRCSRPRSKPMISTPVKILEQHGVTQLRGTQPEMCVHCKIWRARRKIKNEQWAIAQRPVDTAVGASTEQRHRSESLCRRASPKSGGALVTPKACSSLNYKNKNNECSGCAPSSLKSPSDSQRATYAMTSGVPDVCRYTENKLGRYLCCHAGIRR